MPMLGAIVLLIQGCFAYHALKTGRPYWWLFVIMGFPVMGCVLYYFIEVFPTSRESRKAEKAVRALVHFRANDAAEVFRRMLRNADRMPEHYRDAQQEWLTLARGQMQA